MTTQQIAKEILEILKANGAAVRTSYLVRTFGAQTSAALDLLGREIIRVRGQGATVELA